MGRGRFLPSEPEKLRGIAKSVVRIESVETIHNEKRRTPAFSGQEFRERIRQPEGRLESAKIRVLEGGGVKPERSIAGSHALLKERSRHDRLADPGGAYQSDAVMLGQRLEHGSDGAFARELDGVRDGDWELA